MHKKFITEDFVPYIVSRFEEEFPDNIPKSFVVEKTIKYFYEYISKELIAEKVVNLFGFGKFFLRKLIKDKTNSYQYYPKFKFSRHFIYKLREAKGSNTEAAKLELSKKKDFIQQIWEKREKWMLANRSKLPPAYIRYKERFQAKPKHFYDKND